MRKQLIKHQDPALSAESDWYDLTHSASVQLTSEAPDFPIEHALDPGREGEWRASEPGTQVIRLVFDEPSEVRLIHLKFTEAKVERTQEFTLSYQPHTDHSVVELLRQQWNFSPGGSNCETEDYSVQLPPVSALELKIVPDIAGGLARASLREWWIA